MKKKFKKPIKIIVAAMIVAAIAFFYFSFANRPAKIEYTTVDAVRGRLVQTVSETGTVKAEEKLDLRFPGSGIVSAVKAKVGDNVKQGQILAEIDHGALDIRKKEAQAAVNSARARLAKLRAGTLNEDLKVIEANVAKARMAFDSALKEQEKTEHSLAERQNQAKKRAEDLADYAVNTPEEQAYGQAKISLDAIKSTSESTLSIARESALTTAGAKKDAGRLGLDAVKTILANDTDGFKRVWSANNFQYQELTPSAVTEAESSELAAESAISAAKGGNADYDIQQALEKSAVFLNNVLSALNYCYKGLESTPVHSGFTQTQLDAYKTSVSTQISAINTAISALESARQTFGDAGVSLRTRQANAEESVKQAQAALDFARLTAGNSLKTAEVSAASERQAGLSRVDSAQKAWEAAQAEMDKARAGTDAWDIAAAAASVEQAAAGVETVRKQIEDCILKAPIEGVITEVIAKKGEYASPAGAAVSMLKKNELEIEVDISEADIAKLEAGDFAEITFDAFGEDDKIYGEVYFIDPAETLIQGVVYYTVKIKFLSLDKLPVGKAEAIAIEPAAYSSLLSGIKPGMTANAVITTDEKDGVIIIPARGVIDKTGSEGKFVRILAGGQQVERPAAIGLKGDGGLVEALSGVNEGDKIITFVKESK